MNIIAVENHEQMSGIAATIIAAQLALKPMSVLGLATGSTPVRTYEKLVEMCTRKEADFSKATSFNLDEYFGLTREHDQSYYSFMMKNLFGKVNIDVSRVHVPDGMSLDAEAECAAYDDAISNAGGIDLQLLGIGSNGHIGFNEPDDVFVYETHMVELSHRTIFDNARFFADESEVPKRALSMGMGAIMSARRVLLLAGDGKQEIIGRMIHGQIDPKLPASILKVHSDTTIVYVK